MVGGKAMEYYKLRKAGEDIDFIISEEDYLNLAKLYPRNLENLFGDKAVKVFAFELWTSICRFDYSYLNQDAIEENDFLVIGLDRHFLLKGLAAFNDNLRPEKQGKYLNDLKLLAKKIFDVQYGVNNSLSKITVK